MCLYFISLSGVIIKTTIFIIDIIKKIIITTVNIIMFPFKLLINLLSYPVRAIIKWSLKRAAHGKSIARKANRFAKIKMRNFKKEIYIIRKKI
jgi:hypothetical protein